MMKICIPFPCVVAVTIAAWTSCAPTSREVGRVTPGDEDVGGAAGTASGAAGSAAGVGGIGADKGVSDAGAPMGGTGAGGIGGSPVTAGAGGSPAIPVRDGGVDVNAAADGAAVPADARLAGTPFGTTPAWQAGREFDKAFDGDVATFFDTAAEQKDAAHVGLDLGAARVITRVRYYPRADQARRMNGGKFQGSVTSASEGFVDLATVTAAAAGWNELAVTAATPYRWVRWSAPSDSYGNVAEIEIYGRP